MSENRRRYISYLLRLWQVESEGRFVWRTSLQDPRTGQRRGFASLEALFAFLIGETGSEPESDTASEASPQEEAGSAYPE